MCLVGRDGYWDQIVTISVQKQAVTYTSIQTCFRFYFNMLLFNLFMYMYMCVCACVRACEWMLLHLSSCSLFQVSLRPAFSSLKLGSGSSRHQLSQSSDKGPPAAEGPREATMSHVPRTRDDSSDEEDNVRDSVKGGHGK